MADKKIAIILTADNKTKAGFKAVVKNIKDLESATKKTTKGTKGLSSSLGKLVAGFTMANLATRAITAAVGALKNGFTESINTASEYALALAGLASTAAAFGESQDEARASALDLAKDGLVSVATSAQGLKSLMSTGLSLDKATELMRAYKDEAAFGRASTITYEQAVRNLADSFMTESSVIGNLSGQAENYRLIVKAGAAEMGKSVNELTNAERVQAKYLGTLIVATKAEGDAERMSKTYLGTVSALNIAKKNLYNTIGTALIPAMKYLNQSFTDMINSMMPTPDLMVRIGRTAIVVAGGIKQLAIAVSTLANAWFQLRWISAGQALETLKGGWQSLKANVIDVGNRMMAVTEEGMQNIFDFSKETAKSLGDIADTAAKKAADLAKKVSDEIKDYGRDLSKMVSSFNESLNDLVFAHRDKRRKLEKDIANENKAFEKKGKERKEDFDENMAKEEDRHTEKVEKIKSDIKDELEAVRLAENQREAFQDDKYLVDINRHKKKVEDLKASLEKENNEYAKQTLKLKTELDKQTADALEQHKDKLTLLQAELAIELEIEKKHIEDFNRIKDQQKEDDITRLKRKFAEERAERERDHNERLAELYAQGAAEREAINKGREGASTEATTQAIAEVKKRSIGATGTWEAAPIVPLEPIGVGTVTPPSDGGGIISGITSAISDVWSGITNFFGSLPFFQEGGVVSGQPNEPQLAVVHGGETIIPAGQTTGTNIVLNVNIGTLVNSRIERRNFAEQIWLEIGEVARSQNRTPQELLSL